ncbi:MAG: hypothetical protein AAF810_04960 [Cyanobacteria bacterium P01_D01_bin.36]
MVSVNATARNISTIIGGEDWSDYVINFTPIRGGLERDGIASVTGTIEIFYHPSNPSSLDPLLNSAIWKRSQTVRLKVADNSGTLIDHPFGFLYILKVPTLSSDGQLLTVEVGDWLALANKREVPGDSSGVALGTAIDFSVICQNYLEAAGIPTANINLGGAWGYTKALPAPKQGINALAMAGAIAYAANFRVLYQDHDGIVRAHLTTVTPGTPSLSFNATDVPAEWFLREDNPATAAELVKVVATGESVATITSPITASTTSANLDTFTSSSYDLSEEFIGIDSGNLSGRRSVDPNRHASRTEQFRERRPGEQVFETGGSSIKVTVDDTTDYYYYQALPGAADEVFPYRLFEKWTLSTRAKGITDGDDTATTEAYRISFEQWIFDADGVMTEHLIVTYARQKEFEPDGAFGLQWRIIDRLTESWEEESVGQYRYRSRNEVAAITQSQAFNASNTGNKWTLRTTAQENRAPAKQGDNSPPAAELWEGPYSITQESYEGEATYTPPGGASLITPEEVIEIRDGLGISDAICDSIATKEAAIGGGREYPMILTFPVSNALLAIDSPLWQAAYTIDGRIRTYLVDSQAYNHTNDELVCTGLGILIGDVAA